MIAKTVETWLYSTYQFATPGTVIRPGNRPSKKEMAISCVYFTNSIRATLYANCVIFRIVGDLTDEGINGVEIQYSDPNLFKKIDECLEKLMQKSSLRNSVTL